MAFNYNPRKRPRSDTGVTLSHNEYTVGWICAIPCELTAAEAMLDVKHQALDRPLGDKNVYVLGSIFGHNVVITTLPSGTYGTTSAAAVAIRMTTTFRNISIPLLVGVGGGVPKNDLRLGDIVVSVPGESNAVVQYDYGKTLGSGVVQRTGHLRKPEEHLLAAVSLVRARHKVKPTRVPEIMADALDLNPLLKAEFSYPGLYHDRLYQQDCPHVLESRECKECPLSLVEREPRLDNAPKLHYGSIASGNQVIKNSKARDKIASELGTICFEMEAAGVMDYFPALVIRGICDYCDGSKDKTFQPYAAIAAAACAKELLCSIPSDAGRAIAPSVFDTVIKQQTDSVVRDLNFAEAQSRLLTIKEPHPATLQWFLQNKAFRCWLDDSKFAKHHGFLWIKGKPGAGKSTLMKYLLSCYQNTHNTISFFFNARGSELQKTTIGMYRSFLSQLINDSEELGYSLELLTFKNHLNTLEILKNLFKQSIAHLSSPLTCFVDALDESSEDEVRELLEDLEQLTMTAKPGYFRVCCSSRYYPHISIEAGMEIHLDKEADHDIDIRNYVESKLRIGSNDQAKRIKGEVVRKAAGVFLWVVLVVQILGKEFDHGRVHSLAEKLNQIPDKLNDLIKDILLRDNENLPNLVACIQWVLHSRRPLLREEFYYAMLMADQDYDPTCHDLANISVNDMDRFILSSSKGLLELTRFTPPIVQVIHESVRELLLEDKLTAVWSGFADVAPGPSHRRLAERCIRYLSRVGFSFIVSCDDTNWSSGKCIHNLEGRLPYHSDYTGITVGACTNVLSSVHPFLEYAKQQALWHAEKTESYGIQEQEILDAYLPLFITRQLDNRSKSSGNWSRKGLTRLLINENCPRLLQRHLAQPNNAQSTALSRERDLLTSIEFKYINFVSILLHPAPASSVDTALWETSIEMLCDNASSHLRGSILGMRYSFIDIMSRCDEDHALLGYLFGSEEWFKAQLRPWLKQLVVAYAAYRFHNKKHSSATVHNLLPLAAAAGEGFYVDKLLLFGADPKYKDTRGNTALHYAAEFDQASVISKLSRVSNVEAMNRAGLTPLGKAIRADSHQATIKLVQAGADVDAALPPGLNHSRRRQWNSWMKRILEGETDLPPGALRRRLRETDDEDAVQILSDSDPVTKLEENED